MDLILTGASRGIGRALASALIETLADRDGRLFLLARDEGRLRSLVEEAPAGVRDRLVPIGVDLARREAVWATGERLAREVREGALLVHNAGLWPARCELVDGCERAFATNCLGPLALQAPLVEAGRVARVLGVGAGLMIRGRFDEQRTPAGADFSAFGTYAATKLAGAVALRDVARRHPELDVAVVHPGVVRSDLGDRAGLLGLVLRLVKRRWEAPETCAARLVRLIERPRWSERPGEARWFVLEEAQPWPPAADRAEEPVLRAIAAWQAR